MMIQCPNCHSEHRLDDSPAAGEEAPFPCPVCGYELDVDAFQHGGEMECPKCGTRQPRGEECRRCGVIFSKVRDLAGGVQSAGSQENESGAQRAIPSLPAQPVASSGARGTGSADWGTDASRHSGVSPGAAIKFGWKMAWGNLGSFIGLLIVGGILVAVPSLLADLADKHAPAVTRILFRIVAVVLESAVSMGFIKVCLKVHDGEKPQLSDLLECLPLFFKYFFASVLYGLIVLGGLLLLIVPGIVWSVKFAFYAFFIVDQGQGPLEALKSSSKITKGAKMDVFLLGLALVGINLLGLVALLVGLAVSIPVTMLALAHAFRTLSPRSSQL